MKERPILFSGAMVRAILDGSKTQTRRICKTSTQHQTDSLAYALMEDLQGADDGSHEKAAWELIGCPFGQPGDRLWVREAWAPMAITPPSCLVAFRADGEEPNADTALNANLLSLESFTKAHGYLAKGHWIPSIHMLRWASRITLEIESVRVERLQDISEDDALAEGVQPGGNFPSNARGNFSLLWESINGPGSWDENPFVWVVTFKRIGGEA